MAVYEIIFSPTGGTKKVADAVAESWGTVTVIDLSVKDADYSNYRFLPEDVVLIAMPSFGGLAPQTAINRLREIKGGSARCILVVAYGNRAYEDTFVHMQDAAESCGFQVVAAVAAVAEHSIAHEIAAGRPNEGDGQELKEFGKKIFEKLEAGNAGTPEIPGNRPCKIPSGMSMIPVPGDTCNGCGACVKSCPTGAIDPDTFKVTEESRCISCMRCTSVCPQKARGIDNSMLAAVSLMLKKACPDEKKNGLFV